jgi:hypothetical protein
MSAHPQWDAWIDQSLHNIRDKKLERILRPLIPTKSPVVVREKHWQRSMVLLPSWCSSSACAFRPQHVQVPASTAWVKK